MISSFMLLVLIHFLQLVEPLRLRRQAIDAYPPPSEAESMLAANTMGLFPTIMENYVYSNEFLQTPIDPFGFFPPTIYQQPVFAYTRQHVPVPRFNTFTPGNVAPEISPPLPAWSQAGNSLPNRNLARPVPAGPPDSAALVPPVSSTGAQLANPVRIQNFDGSSQQPRNTIMVPRTLDVKEQPGQQFAGQNVPGKSFINAGSNLPTLPFHSQIPPTELRLIPDTFE
ncbi:hypothetical protein RB195_020222 [Necator americanus]|uniref:Uncharacterized protein n=2 Tax=Necator americanus TaxID=51031 RepID=A0ABR1CJD3_NECAM